MDWRTILLGLLCLFLAAFVRAQLPQQESLVFDFFVCNPSENYCYFPTKAALDFEGDGSFLGIDDDFDGDDLNNSVDFLPYGRYNSIADRPPVQNGLFVTGSSFFESDHLFFHSNFFEPVSSFEFHLSPGFEIGACTTSASYSQVRCFVENHDTLVIVFNYVEDANLLSNFSFDVLAENPDFTIFSQRFHLTVVNLCIYQGFGPVDLPSSASALAHPFLFKVDANNSLVGLRWMPLFALLVFIIAVLVLYLFEWNKKLMIALCLLAIILILAIMVFNFSTSLLVALAFSLILALIVAYIIYKI